MISSALPASPGEVARHYDQLDRFFRDIWGDHVHHGLWLTGRETFQQALRNMVDEVIRRLSLSPGMSVCDVGCGYGRTAILLAQELGVQVTGVTVSPAQQAYAEKATPAGLPVDFVLEDWLENQRPPEIFDAVIAIESTEHMADKARVFSEAVRVLKPGGRLVVCAWMAAKNPRPWQQRHLLKPICQESHQPNLGTESEYLRWMQEAGFQLQEATDVSHQVRRTWPAYAWQFLTGALRRPSLLRYLLDPRHHNARFGLTMLRFILAYRTGALRYLIFTAVKHPNPV